MGARRLATEAYRYAATLQGWSLFGALTLFGGLLVVPVLMLRPVWPGVRERFADAVHRVLGFYLRHVLYMRVQVENADKRLATPRILVANHQSWLDPLVLMGLEPRLAGPVRRYMLRVPIFGRIVRLAGFYPSEIGELPSFEAVARSVETARARGGSLLFFPEGTRSEGGVVGSFHRGAFRAAYDHALPVQPVVIEGLDRVLPRHGPVVQTPGRSLVRVRYLDPIAPPFEGGAGEARRRDAVRALAETVRSRLVEELGKMRAERPGAP